MPPKTDRKDRAIRLHALLARVRHALETHNLAPPDAFREYDALHTTPTHVHASKAAHQEAIEHLALGIHRTTPPRREPVALQHDRL